MRKRSNHRRSWFQRVAGVEVEFLAADFVDFRYPKHVHESLAVGVIEEGAQAFGTSRGMFTMPRREVCVVDAGLVHWGWGSDHRGWRYRMLYPPIPLVAAALEVEIAHAERLGFGRHSIADSDLFARFRRLHRAAALGADVDAAVLRFLRDLFARHALVRPELDEPSLRVADDMREYLHSHPSTRVTSEDLARAAGVSVGHAIRSFTAAMGISPAAYHVAYRVDRARPLLAAGRPVAQVAAELGFFDQAHFHRHFARHVGCAPGRYLAAS